MKNYMAILPWISSAAWMVVSDKSNSEDGNKDLFSSSPYPSLDELLDGFNPNNKNDKFSIARSFPDSDDKNDEGDLDEWEDNSEETELEYTDKVVRESVPLEGEMEDLGRPEELWASTNPIPIENDAQRTSTPIPESIFGEDTEGVLLPVPTVAVEADERRGRPIPGTPRKEANAITTPHMQTEGRRRQGPGDDPMAF